MAGLRPDHEELLVIPWLGPLLQTGFFGHCRNHNSVGKHERNHFCLDCHGSAGALCPEGLGENHKNHLSLQIRKASHRDAVRISDIQKLLDVSGIQAYTINSAKILFLQSRAPQPQQQKLQKSSSCSKGGGGVRFNCETCHRSITDQVRFCSINCKRLAVGDSNLVAPVAQDQQQFIIDHPSSHHLNLAACSSEDYSLLQFHTGHDKITNVQGSSFESSSTELQQVPNLITSFRDHARAWHELQAYNSMRTTTTQAENSPLWMQDQSGAASMQKKRKKFCSTPHDHPHQQPQQQLHELGSSNFLLTSSPMSVLALHHHHHHHQQQQQQPASRSSRENSWSCKSDLSPRSFFGPSTPPSIEEASSRTHSRKQCHPHRAPLF